MFTWETLCIKPSLERHDKGQCGHCNDCNVIYNSILLFKTLQMHILSVLILKVKVHSKKKRLQNVMEWQFNVVSKNCT